MSGDIPAEMRPKEDTKSDQKKYAPQARQKQSRPTDPHLNELSNKVGAEYDELLARAQSLRTAYEEMNSHQKNLKSVFEELQAAAASVGTDQPVKVEEVSATNDSASEVGPSDKIGEPGQYTVSAEPASILHREPAQIVTGVIGVILGVATILGYSFTAEQVTALGGVLTLLVPLILTYAGGLFIRHTVTQREAGNVPVRRKP